MKTKVLIVDRIYKRSAEIFSAADDIEFIAVGSEEDVVADAITRSAAEAVVLATEKYTGRLYEALAEGGLIARYGVGHDGINKSLASAKRQPVVITPGVLDNSVAEHTIFLMGALARNIASSNAALKNNQWDKSTGAELSGKTLAVIGCGAIGCKVAKIASFGFGMKVIGFDVARLDIEQLRQSYGISSLAATVEQAVSNADVVSIHLPAIEATENFVSADFISKLKPSAMLINTSRGSIVDEAALYDALKENKIGGAAIDVYKKEPYTPQSPDKDLRKLNNIIMTPHLGSSTNEASEKMAEIVLKNIRLWKDGNFAGMDIVNKDIL